MVIASIHGLIPAQRRAVHPVIVGVWTRRIKLADAVTIFEDHRIGHDLALKARGLNIIPSRNGFFKGLGSATMHLRLRESSCVGERDNLLVELDHANANADLIGS